MSNPVQDMLFKNASFMKALDKTIDSKTESVTFDGKKWHIGTVDIKCRDKKLNFFEATFAKITHGVHAFFSEDYAKRFDRTVKLFEQAFENAEETKNSAFKAHSLMVQTTNTDQTVQTLESQLKGVSNQIQTAPQDLIDANQALIDAQEKLISNQEEKTNLQQEINQLKETFGGRIQALLHMPGAELAVLQTRFNKLIDEEVSIQGEIAQARQQLDDLAIQHERALAPLKQQERTLSQQLTAAKAQLTKLRPPEEVKAEEPAEPAVVEETAAPVETQAPPFALNAATLQFLDAVGEKCSPEMRQILESMFTNISMKYGENVIEKFTLSPDGTATVTFKERIHFWMPTTNDAGDIDPKKEPVGGAIFTYGDENRQMQFNLSKNSLEVKNGWDVKARIPSAFDFLKGFVGTWPEAHVLKISTGKDMVTISGGKKVMGFLRKKDTVRPLDKSVTNWLNNGEIVPLASPTTPTEALEGFLAAKFKQ